MTFVPSGRVTRCTPADADADTARASRIGKLFLMGGLNRTGGYHAGSPGDLIEWSGSGGQELFDGRNRRREARRQQGGVPPPDLRQVPLSAPPATERRADPGGDVGGGDPGRQIGGH